MIVEYYRTIDIIDFFMFIFITVMLFLRLFAIYQFPLKLFNNFDAIPHIPGQAATHILP